MYALVDSAAAAAEGDGHVPPDVDVDLVQFKRQRVGPFSTVFDLGSGTTVFGVQGNSGASPPADFEALLRAVPLNIPFGGEIQLKFRFPVYEVTLHNVRRHGPDHESDLDKWTFHVEGRTATDVFSHGLTLGGVWGIVSTAGKSIPIDSCSFSFSSVITSLSTLMTFTTLLFSSNSAKCAIIYI